MSLRPIPRDRAEWLALRHNYICASEVCCLFGLQAKWADSAFTLHHIKSGRVPAVEMEDNDRMRWGRRHEAFIAIETGCVEGFKIRKGKFAICDDRPDIAATLDFIIPAHPLWTKYPGPGALECKAIDYLVWVRDWQERPTFQIEAQLQAQLIATGWEWGLIAVLVGGNDLKLFYRHKRDDVQAQIRDRVAKFWAGVRLGVPPEPCNSDSTLDTIKALYPAPPADPETECPDRLHPLVHSMCGQFMSERETRLAAVPREAAAKNLLLATLADGARMLVPAVEFGDPAYLVTRSKSGVLAVKEVSP